MSLTQLNPAIPVEVVGKGRGRALLVIDYSEEEHLIWVVALDDTGEIWAMPNPQVRLRDNQTFGRRLTS